MYGILDQRGFLHDYEGCGGQAADALPVRRWSARNSLSSLGTLHPGDQVSGARRGRRRFPHESRPYLRLEVMSPSCAD